MSSFTFPFLAHLSHWLMVSYCDRWMSVVRHHSCVVCRQQLLQRTSPPKQLAGFLPNLAGLILMWPSWIIVQVVSVCCIYRSYRLNIGFQNENFKIFLPETKSLRALIFDICYVASSSRPVTNLFKLCPYRPKMSPP